MEAGVNTRHWDPAPGNERVAFRSMDPPDVSEQASTAVTTSIRFSTEQRYNTYLGGEGETGVMLGRPGSNIAGAYAIVGTRGEVGRLRLAAELVAGRRWIRYALDGTQDAALMMAEPRVRGEMFVASRWTLGGAVGATLSERNVWLAGIYIGIHSADFDKW